MGLTAQEQRAVEDFRRDIVEPSMTSLVILDFWAEWCGPCKALTPVLEKVAADYADKGVVLAKINVDENGFIASQFQVRSIPTVYAMFQGQPVADLTSARTESQLKAMLDQLLAQLPVTGGAGPAFDPEPLLTAAEEALAAGDSGQALGLFSDVLEQAPDNVAALGGLVRALVAEGRFDDAESMLGALDDKTAKDPAIDRARAALALAKDAPDVGELAGLKAAVDAAPTDMDAQFAYANALFASGARDEAADRLLAMIAADRAWNDGAARARLLQIFETIGLEDPWVAGVRRRLSIVLFG